MAKMLFARAPLRAGQMESEACSGNRARNGARSEARRAAFNSMSVPRLKRARIVADPASTLPRVPVVSPIPRRALSIGTTHWRVVSVESALASCGSCSVTLSSGNVTSGAYSRRSRRRETIARTITASAITQRVTRRSCMRDLGDGGNACLA
jgi:hypothetical protein